jgi:peptidoglycan/LPS O-acetylase OafA/YrhL
MQKLGNVDGIRGLAILMVVMVHTAQSVDGKPDALRVFTDYGQMGVQLFFVASAFTLCHSWFGRSDGEDRLRAFWLRRYFRIAPMYYLGIPLYALVEAAWAVYANGAALALPAQYREPAHVLANLTFVHGFVPAANNSIVPGGWSIGTEMAFYALFPLLATLLAAFARRGRTALLLAALGTVALSQAGLTLAMHFTGLEIGNNGFLYFNLIVQLPVFVFGIVYYLLDRADSWPLRGVGANALGVVAGTAATLLLWYGALPLRFAWLPVAAGLSFVCLFALFARLPALSPRWLRRLGELSFSIYIVHFLFAHKLVYAVAAEVVAAIGPVVATLLFVPATVLASAALARLSERWVERPGIALGRRVIAALRARRQDAATV